MGVAHVVSDMNPAAAPSLFALDAGDYSLRLHAQHPGSRMWKSQNLLQHKAEAYEVVRYRTEIRIIDGNGRAIPNQQVTLTSEKDGSTVEVAVAEKFAVQFERPQQLIADGFLVTFLYLLLFHRLSARSVPKLLNRRSAATASHCREVALESPCSRTPERLSKGC